MNEACETLFCTVMNAACHNDVCRSTNSCVSMLLREHAGVIAVWPTPETPLPPIVPEMLDKTAYTYVPLRCPHCGVDSTRYGCFCAWD